MKIGKKLIIKRQFTDDFKRTLIKEYESGHYTISELSILYSITRTVIYRWIHRYSTYNNKRAIIVEMKDSSKKKVQQLSKRIKELERIVGQKQIKIDLLEKIIEIAEQEYQLDIKKNSSTSQSDGSDSTPDNSPTP